MKTGLKMAMHGWSYHLVAALICLMFISGISGWLSIALNAVLMIAIWGMVFNDGAYNGEKACTLAASLEKQEKEGRRVDEKLKTQVYNKKVAAWVLIIGMLPLLLVSTANLIAAPFFPETEVAQTVEEEESFSFDYDYEEKAAEEVPVNGFNVAARLVFMPYVAVYSLVSSGTLNWLFLLFSLPLPLFQCIGYLFGPKLRAKKLHDIALGKKRKQRNLKVHKKPRQQKAEV